MSTMPRMNIRIVSGRRMARRVRPMVPPGRRYGVAVLEGAAPGVRDGAAPGAPDGEPPGVALPPGRPPGPAVDDAPAAPPAPPPPPRAGGSATCTARPSRSE